MMSACQEKGSALQGSRTPEVHPFLNCSQETHDISLLQESICGSGCRVYGPSLGVLLIGMVSHMGGT